MSYKTITQESYDATAEELISKMKGISHITLICRDIDKSAELFCDLFGAEEVYSSDNHNFSISREKFLLIDDLWIALMEGGPIDRSYNHIAFHINDDELHCFEEKIKKYNLDILPGRLRDPREGKSIYFYDYDNHLFELHTGDLKSRLKFYHSKDSEFNLSPSIAAIPAT